MAIFESVGRLGSTLVDMVHTRLELAAVEVEEESQRMLGYLLAGLLALILFGVAFLLLAFLVIVLFWDTHRVAAVGGMAALFAAAGAIIAIKVKAGFDSKPRLLQNTIEELRKDIAYVRSARDIDE
ncbi:MAG TPA: phage holin family protein [Telluria sp.]